MMNEKEKMAYLAGVMDGDGSFSIYKLMNLSKSPLYAPALQCATWRMEYLNLLKETFGGNFVTGKVHICKDGSDGHALTNWSLRSAINCKPALEALIPYLKIKKERAMHLLKYIEENPFTRGKTLGAETLRRRESSYLAMIQFNDWKGASSTITKSVAKENTKDTVFWAYVAGLIDTDGSFSVKKQVKNKGTEVINPRYLPVICVNMTDSRGINYIRENCSLGKFYVPKNNGTRKGLHYQYGIYSKKECISFLENVIPFLQSKRPNAEVLLDFCVNSKNTGYCKAGISADELSFRNSCYKRLCELNKYGVVKSSLMDLKPLTGKAEGNKGQE